MPADELHFRVRLHYEYGLSILGIGHPSFDGFGVPGRMCGLDCEYWISILEIMCAKLLTKMLLLLSRLSGAYSILQILILFTS